MKKLKLSELTKNALSQKGLKNVIGGLCGCACAYEGTPGGSSISANRSANNAGGKESPGDGPQYWTFEYWECAVHAAHNSF